MRLDFVLTAIIININKSIFFSITVHLQITILWTRRKLYLRQNDVDSKTCYYFLAYLAVVHFQTIYFAQSDLPEPEKKFYRVSWLSNYDIHRQNTIYMPFFWHFIQFSIGLLYKDVTQSDRIQQCDFTVSSEAFGCFRKVFGKSNPQISFFHHKKNVHIPNSTRDFNLLRHNYVNIYFYSKVPRFKLESNDPRLEMRISQWRTQRLLK